MSYLNGERTVQEGEEEGGNAPTGTEVMIFDLHSGDPNDYKLALLAMQKAKEIADEKVIIVISSLMVWNNTPRKWKEKGQPDPVHKNKDDDEEAEEEPKDEGEPRDEEDADKKEDEDDADRTANKTQDIVLTDDEDIPEVPKELVQIAFTERDFEMRQPTPEYQLIKEIEDELLAF